LVPFQPVEFEAPAAAEPFATAAVFVLTVERHIVEAT